ncbi:MAG: T9SS type A sorting domain-containing protein [Polaribacter sp.]
MKKNYLFTLLLSFCLTFSMFGQDLIISGVIDAPLSGGTPKALELYVINDISDLSVYGVESVTNGNASSDAPEYTFPADAVTSGTYIYLEAVSGSNPTAFNDFFGFTSTYQNGVLSVNGDDPIKLYKDGTAVDVFGSVGTDGTGEPWEYQDGWAYRKSGSVPSATFNLSEWTFSGSNALDNESTNATASTPFPNGTYSATASTEPSLIISSPTEATVYNSNIVNVTIDVANFTVSADNGSGVSDNSGDGYIKSTLVTVGGSTENADFFTTTLPQIEVVPGSSYTLTLELVDNSGSSLSPAVSKSVSFSSDFPCELALGEITTSCDAVTSASDTYSGTIAFTGGNTNATYTITAPAGVTVAGDNPDTVAEGIITFAGMTEGTDTEISIVGATNSSCDLLRTLFSPVCTPLPISEDFSYADGSLTDNPLWSGFSGTDGDLMVNSGQALVQHGTPSEDAQIEFASISGDIYYSFDFTVVDPGAPIPGNDNEYFAVFKDSGFGFTGRIDIVPPNDATSGDFSVGIATDGSTADAVWASDFVFDTTYRATVKYDQVANVAQLWIDASSESDPSISGADLDDANARTIVAFALRQSDSNSNEGILVDNLKIAGTFADTTLSVSSLEIDGFALYPNPVTNNNLTITSNSAEVKNVSIFNVLGKNVLSRSVSGNKAEINTGSLSSGIYIIKVQEGLNTATSKLVIK